MDWLELCREAEGFQLGDKQWCRILEAIGRVVGRRLTLAPVHMSAAVCEIDPDGHPVPVSDDQWRALNFAWHALSDYLRHLKRATVHPVYRGHRRRELSFAWRDLVKTLGGVRSLWGNPQSERVGPRRANGFRSPDRGRAQGT